MRLVTPGTTDYSTIIYTYAPDGSALVAVTAGDYPDAGTIYYTLETDSGITKSFLEPTDLASAGAAHSDAGVYPLGDGANRLDVPDALLANPGTLRFYGEGDEIVVLGQPIVIGSPAYARLGAPAGASIAADLATVDGVADAIKAKTDNLPASPAAVGSAMTLTSGERESIGTAVWATTTRTLSSFGTLVSDIATAVWGAVTRTITGGTVSTVSDKTGYSLATAPPTAAQIQTQMEGEGSKLALIDAAIAALNDYDGSDPAGVTTLLERLTATRAGYLDAAITTRSTFDAATQSVNVAHVGQEAIDAESFSQDAQTTLAAAIWGALTSVLTATGSIGKALADMLARWGLMTETTGDPAYPRFKGEALEQAPEASVTLDPEDIETIGESVSSVVAAAFGEQLDRIEDQTDKIGGVTLPVRSAVIDGGTIELYSGADYTGARSLGPWTLPAEPDAGTSYELRIQTADQWARRDLLRPLLALPADLDVVDIRVEIGSDLTEGLVGSPRVSDEYHWQIIEMITVGETTKDIAVVVDGWLRVGKRIDQAAIEEEE